MTVFAVETEKVHDSAAQAPPSSGARIEIDASLNTQTVQGLAARASAALSTQANVEAAEESPNQEDLPPSPAPVFTVAPTIVEISGLASPGKDGQVPVARISSGTAADAALDVSNDPRNTGTASGRADSSVPVDVHLFKQACSSKWYATHGGISPARIQPCGPRDVATGPTFTASSTPINIHVGNNVFDGNTTSISIRYPETSTIQPSHRHDTRLVFTTIEAYLGTTSTTYDIGAVQNWTDHGATVEPAITAQTGPGPVHYGADWTAYNQIAVAEEERETFASTQERLSMFAPKSEVVPATMDEWISYRCAVFAANGRALEARFLNQTTALFAAAAAARPEIPPLCKVALQDGRSAVLARRTVWCRKPYQRARHQAPWPSREEFVWEGDSRAKTGFGRFLPLMRVRGNASVAWFMLSRRPEHDFDRVWPIPTAEDIEWASIADDQMCGSVINSGLWQAIDEAGSL